MMTIIGASLREFQSYNMEQIQLRIVMLYLRLGAISGISRTVAEYFLMATFVNGAIASCQQQQTHNSIENRQSKFAMLGWSNSLQNGLPDKLSVGSVGLAKT
jgi:hypothetical protein